MIDLKSFANLKGLIDTFENLPTEIFARQYYPTLLKAIRRGDPYALMIGNPGTSKSWFQLYYLAAIADPILCGMTALPANDKNSIEAPEIVIRQVGSDSMFVYFIKAKVVHKVKCGRSIFKTVDTSKSLYMYEPDKYFEEPYYRCELRGQPRIRTLVTVSPDISRYKEYAKQTRPTIVYMPCYSEDELLDIGRYLRDQPTVPSEVKELYLDTTIRERFDLFGGIIRYVLPKDVDSANNALSMRDKAIANLNQEVLVKILKIADIEQPEVSHLLVQYVVKHDTPEDFKKYTMNTLKSVVSALNVQLYKVDIVVRIITLLRNDITGFMDSACPDLYEGVVADLLTGKDNIAWYSRSLLSEEWEPFNVKLKEEISTKEVHYEDMVPEKLYFPSDPNFPLVDMYYILVKGGPVYGVQVTRGQNPRAAPEKIKMDSFFKRIQLSELDQEKFIYLYCPPPTIANSAFLTMQKRESSNLQIDVLKLPVTYLSNQI